MLAQILSSSLLLAIISCGSNKQTTTANNNNNPIEQTTTTNTTTTTSNNTPTNMPNQEVLTAYDFELTDINGTPFTLKKYSGKKILLVNTASACGYTPQYAALEELSKQYADKLIVVGFPANNFGGQEPGTNKEIKGFCQKNYGVSFPLSEKVSVVGDDAAPLFKWLTNSKANGGIEATIKWNFTKFLIDETGHLLANYPSSVKPLDAAIVSKL